MNGLNDYYLYHFILSHLMGYFDSIVDRVSIPHLTKEKSINVSFLTPPIQEQKQIAGYLDKETDRIDSLAELESKRMELLNEYRQSLISDAVTGKIDVRGMN